MMKIWKKGVFVLLASMGAFLSGAYAADKGQSDSASMIGATVVGGGGYSTLGKIVGVARGGQDGPVQMYVVRVGGLFGGRGVIPVSHVIDEMAVPEKDGSISYRVEVSVNKATFRNIAKWENDESLSSYLQRLDSILGTVYGVDQATMDAYARNLVFDEEIEVGGAKASVATL